MSARAFCILLAPFKLVQPMNRNRQAQMDGLWRRLSSQIYARLFLSSRRITKALALCVLLPLLTITEAGAATITNYLRQYWLYALTINVGDSIVWVNEQTSPSTNYVESYGGEWKSPTLYYGDSFSYTFTNAGFYAYRTGQSYPFTGAPGTITVNGWLNAPPAVTINTPVEGFVFPPLTGHTVTLQASVTNADNFPLIEYFANSNLIAVATNPPYSVQWTSPPAGPYEIVATATDLSGNATTSAPVNVLVGREACLWGTRVLPGGKALFFFNPFFAPAYTVFGSSDNLGSNFVANFISFSPGVFVDETAPAAPSRFYRALYKGK
jgi:hypothetical protein